MGDGASVAPASSLRPLSCYQAVGGLRLAGPALSFAKLRSGKSQAKRPGSRLRADSLQSLCRPLGRSPRVMFGNRPRQGCRSRGCRTGCSQIRRGTDVVMSGIVESGRESGHGDIDANDPLAEIKLPFGPISAALSSCATLGQPQVVHSLTHFLRRPRCLQSGILFVPLD
jgi:hypothetical protein